MRLKSMIPWAALALSLASASVAVAQESGVEPATPTCTTSIEGCTIRFIDATALPNSAVAAGPNWEGAAGTVPDLNIDGPLNQAKAGQVVVVSEPSGVYDTHEAQFLNWALTAWQMTSNSVKETGVIYFGYSPKPGLRNKTEVFLVDAGNRLTTVEFVLKTYRVIEGRLTEVETKVANVQTDLENTNTQIKERDKLRVRPEVGGTVVATQTGSAAGASVGVKIPVLDNGRLAILADGTYGTSLVSLRGDKFDVGVATGGSGGLVFFLQEDGHVGLVARGGYYVFTPSADLQETLSHKAPIYYLAPATGGLRFESDWVVGSLEGGASRATHYQAEQGTAWQGTLRGSLSFSPDLSRVWTKIQARIDARREEETKKPIGPVS